MRILSTVLFSLKEARRKFLSGHYQLQNFFLYSEGVILVVCLKYRAIWSVLEKPISKAICEMERFVSVISWMIFFIRVCFICLYTGWPIVFVNFSSSDRRLQQTSSRTLFTCISLPALSWMNLSACFIWGSFI